MIENFSIMFNVGEYIHVMSSIFSHNSIIIILFLCLLKIHKILSISCFISSFFFLPFLQLVTLKDPRQEVMLSVVSLKCANFLSSFVFSLVLYFSQVTYLVIKYD